MRIKPEITGKGLSFPPRRVGGLGSTLLMVSDERRQCQGGPGSSTHTPETNSVPHVHKGHGPETSNKISGSPDSPESSKALRANNAPPPAADDPKIDFQNMRYRTF